MTDRRDLAVHRRAAITGLGLSQKGQNSGPTRTPIPRRAVADAGLDLADIDGLLVSGGVTNGVNLGLQVDLGLRNLRLLTQLQAFGSTAGAMVQYAALAVES